MPTNIAFRMGCHNADENKKTYAQYASTNVRRRSGCRRNDTTPFHAFQENPFTPPISHLSRCPCQAPQKGRRGAARASRCCRSSRSGGEERGPLSWEPNYTAAIIKAVQLMATNTGWTLDYSEELLCRGGLPYLRL